MGAVHRITSVNYRKPYRPRAIALINTIGGILRSLGFKGPSMDVKSLMEAAVKKSGLDDFGEKDFIQRMGILLDSLEREGRLHFTGRFMVSKNIIRLLSNRLRIHHELNHIKGISEIDMDDPVFVVGLQRTGTTMLHRMLSADMDNFRFLASWEAINPAPIKCGEDSSKESRVRMAETAQKALKYLAPDFFAIHPVDARGPEEDCMLFDYDFWSTVPEATQRVPTFSRWLEEQDHTGAYRYYKNILKYLYWQNPKGRWVLKTPQHMEHFSEILKVFPGAKFIHTHRDPARVIASFCSMVAHAYGIFSDEVDPFEIGRHWSAKALRMVNHSIAIREEAGPDSFIDILYADMMKDQVGVMRDIYTFLGIPFRKVDEERILNWKSSNPQHRYGKHKYSLADFGLNADEIRNQFKHYSERFDIPVEEE